MHNIVIIRHKLINKKHEKQLLSVMAIQKSQQILHTEYIQKMEIKKICQK